MMAFGQLTDYEMMGYLVGKGEYKEGCPFIIVQVKGYLVVFSGEPLRVEAHVCVE
jgi:hypothetical protein